MPHRIVHFLRHPIKTARGWFRERKTLLDSFDRLEQGGEIRFEHAKLQFEMATADARSAAADRRDAVADLKTANDEVREAVRRVVARREAEDRDV
jgi:hypothetical protein